MSVFNDKILERKNKLIADFNANRKKYIGFGLLSIFLFLTVIYLGPFGTLERLGLFGKKKQTEQQSRAEGISAVPDEILLRFKPGADKDERERVLKDHGLSVKEEIQQIDVKVVKVDEHARDHVIQALSHNPAVDFAEVNGIAKTKDTIPNDPQFSPNQWNLLKIKAPSGWDITTGSSSVVIAMLDTGIYAAHPDLTGKITAGYNFVAGSTDTADDNGHGTWTSGVASAATNNVIGMAGVSWLSQLMPIKICDASGSCTYSNAANGMIYAADHGAKVINMSIGGTTSCPSTVQSAADYAWNKGLVSVAASGNETASAVDAPANCVHVVAVGATDSTDTRASWSNYGSALAVVAPGVTIVCPTLSGGYGGCTGTSFATPHVAGLASLLFAKGATNVTAVSAIENGADDLGTAGWDQYYGWGRINAYKSLQLLTGGTPPPADTTIPTVSISFPTSGSTVSGAINVDVSASDNVGISKVELYVDGTIFATDTASPYSFFWDTTKVSNASHNLAAKAYDAVGNIGTSGTVAVTVNNVSPSSSPSPSPLPTPTPSPSSGDTTQPTVSITSPVDSATLSKGKVNITADAQDNVGVTKVEFSVNGALTCTSTSSPYSCSWQVPGKPNAIYTLTAKAYDVAGNNAFVTITVKTSK